MSFLEKLNSVAELGSPSNDNGGVPKAINEVVGGAQNNPDPGLAARHFSPGSDDGPKEYDGGSVKESDLAGEVPNLDGTVMEGIEGIPESTPPYAAHPHTEDDVPATNTLSCHEPCIVEVVSQNPPLDQFLVGFACPPLPTS